MDTSAEDIIIVGAGIAGLAAAVGLHRQGFRSVVLESSDTLRSTGFALTTWSNAWKALDALGVGDSLRAQHLRLEALVVVSACSGSVASEISLDGPKKRVECEVRCLMRTLLVEALINELPQGTIRYSSKVTSIEDLGKLKILHLSDGSAVKAKVLIGSDGINSIVSKWLGLKEPNFTGRFAARGFAVSPNGHGIKPEFAQYFGKGFRAGILPPNEKSIYWFFTWTSSGNEEEISKDAMKVRDLVLDKLTTSKVPEEVLKVIEQTDLSSVACAPLRYRSPFNLLWADMSKGNVCVTGDALHAMTPDLGQGGCSALEDGVVLARCLGEALGGGQNGDEDCRIEAALTKYARARRWRSFDLISTSYVLGFIQEARNSILRLLRDHVLSGFLAMRYFAKADFDCGELYGCS